MDEVNRYCAVCGAPRAPADGRCRGCGALTRVSPRVWYAVTAVLGALQVGWGLAHGLGPAAAVALGVLEAGLVGAVLVLLHRRVGSLGRRGGASYPLAASFAVLTTAALCVPIYPWLAGDSGLPVTVEVLVTIVGMPLLIGLPAGLWLSRGLPTHVPSRTCGQCRLEVPLTATFCTGCGTRLRTA